MIMPISDTTKLNAGLVMVMETRLLLDLWKLGDTSETLYVRALQSRHLPQVSARWLRNIIVECFFPRYRRCNIPTAILKHLSTSTAIWEWQQLLLLLTARANRILHDFVRQVYWPAYAAGKTLLTRQEARHFVQDAVAVGLTSEWGTSQPIGVERAALHHFVWLDRLRIRIDPGGLPDGSDGDHHRGSKHLVAAPDPESAPIVRDGGDMRRYGRSTW